MIEKRINGGNYQPVMTDKLVLDSTPTVNSLNGVTSDAVARAVAGASGEVPQVTENDNGKVLTAIYDESGPAVEWGDAPSGLPDSTGASQGDVLTIGSSGLEWATPSAGGGFSPTLVATTPNGAGDTSAMVKWTLVNSGPLAAGWYILETEASVVTQNPNTPVDVLFLYKEGSSVYNVISSGEGAIYNTGNGTVFKASILVHVPDAISNSLYLRIQIPNASETSLKASKLYAL